MRRHRDSWRLTWPLTVPDTWNAIGGTPAPEWDLLMLRRFWFWERGEWVMVVDFQMQGGPESETGRMDYDFMHCMTEFPLCPPYYRKQLRFRLKPRWVDYVAHLSRIHRGRASGWRPEAARWCSSESGMMVL